MSSLSRLYEIFTHVDDLPRVSTDAIYNETEKIAKFNHSPSNIFDQAIERIYKAKPVYNLVSCTESTIPIFVVDASYASYKGRGEGKTKKAAKHQAACVALHQFVDTYADFLPYFPPNIKDAQSAHDYIKQLENGTANRELAVPITSAAESDTPFNDNTNYVGKVQELSDKNKLDCVEYTCTEEGPPNDKTFYVTCKLQIAKQEAKESARTKKRAKMMAAWRMLCILEKGVNSMDQELKLDELDDEDLDDELVESVNGPVQTTEQSEKVLEEVMNADDSGFSNVDIEYRILDRHSELDEVECLLKLAWGSESERIRHVVPGKGSTEAIARREAAAHALRYLIKP